MIPGAARRSSIVSNSGTGITPFSPPSLAISAISSRSLTACPIEQIYCVMQFGPKVRCAAAAARTIASSDVVSSL